MVVICCYFIWRRVSVPEVRFVTTTQDWFVVLLVGVQGVAEFLVSGILGGIVARAVAKYLK